MAVTTLQHRAIYAATRRILKRNYERAKLENRSAAFNAYRKAYEFLKVLRDANRLEEFVLTTNDAGVQAITVPSRTSTESYTSTVERCGCPATKLPEAAGNAPSPCWHRAMVYAMLKAEERLEADQELITAVEFGITPIVENGNVTKVVTIGEAHNWFQRFETTLALTG